MTAAALINLLALAAKAAAVGVSIAQTAKATRDMLDIMVEEGREPTQAEWDTALQRAASLHDQIQGS